MSNNHRKKDVKKEDRSAGEERRAPKDARTSLRIRSGLKAGQSAEAVLDISLMPPGTPR
jgi:hypothetical protein